MALEFDIRSKTNIKVPTYYMRNENQIRKLLFLIKRKGKVCKHNIVLDRKEGVAKYLLFTNPVTRPSKEGGYKRYILVQ